VPSRGFVELKNPQAIIDRPRPSAMKALVFHVPEDRIGLRRGLNAPPEIINHFLIAMLDARREQSGNSLLRRPEVTARRAWQTEAHPRYGSDARGGAWSRSGPRGERSQGWDTVN
jgi:hypothetical protein